MASVIKSSNHRARRADGIAGISGKGIRKCARRGGVKRIETSIYQTTREVLECKLREIIPRAMRYAQLHNRTTVNTFDIVYAIKDSPGMCSGMVSPMLCPPNHFNNTTTISIPATTSFITVPAAAQPITQVPEVPRKSPQASTTAPVIADYNTRMRNWQAIPNDVKRAMRRGARAADFDVSDTTDEFADADALERTITLPPVWDEDNMPDFKYSDDEERFDQIDRWRHAVAVKTQSSLSFRIGKTPSTSSMGKN